MHFLRTGALILLCSPLLFAQISSRDTGTCDKANSSGRITGNGPCTSSTSGSSGGSQPSFSNLFHNLFGHQGVSASRTPLDYPNVVKSGRYLYPASGYHWTNPHRPSAAGYRVEPNTPGTPHVWLPNVVYVEGGIGPAPGYWWESYGDVMRGKNYRVVPLSKSHLVVLSDGSLQAAPGYRFVNPNPSAYDLRVEPIPMRERSAELSAEAFKRGNELFDQGRYPEAEAAFKESFKLDPDAPTAGNVGLALRNQNRDLEAEQWFRKAIELDPEYARARGELGVLLVNTRRWAEGEPELRRALVRMPDNEYFKRGMSRAVLSRAIDLGSEKKFAECEQAAREALVHDPAYGFAYRILGAALNELKRYSEAEAALRKGMALLPPDNVGVRRNLGRALEEQQRYEEAGKIYAEALRLNPDNEESRSEYLRNEAKRVAAGSAAGGTLQQFPAGNKDVSPGTAASALPQSTTGGGSAMQQAAAASESGKAAVAAGLSGGALPSGEAGSDKARSVFETPVAAASVGESSSIVDASSVNPRELPKWVQEHPKMRQLAADQKALEEQRAAAVEEYQTARALRILHEEYLRRDPDPKELLQESNLKAKVFQVETQIQVKEKEKQNLGILLFNSGPGENKSGDKKPAEKPPGESR